MALMRSDSITQTTQPLAVSAAAARLTPTMGLRSAAARGRSRNETFADMSGRIRGSIWSNCSLMSRVAFARSIVGTIRATRPANRSLGMASSPISTGWPTEILAMLDSETSDSTSRVDMSAMVTTAPLESAADENGVMLSPMLAFLVRTTPSKGARISACASAARETWAAA